MLIRRLAAFCSCVLIAAQVAAQESPQPMLFGESFVLESRILDESRPIFIAAPPPAGQGPQRYGVLYVLDGETQFQHAAASVRFLGEFPNQVIPPLLVVGIGNTDRMRDLTPAAGDRQDRILIPSGAEPFLRFIVDELMPWVAGRYPTSSYSVLAGHSLGGLFATHVFISEPEAFDAYLMIDPSLNWNDQSLMAQAESFLGNAADLHSAIHLTVSSIDDPALDGARRFARLLETRAAGSLRFDLLGMTAESHGTVPLPGMYRGLQWVFAEWNVDPAAEALFGERPAAEIMTQIDLMFRQSAEQFDAVRETPYSVFESLLTFLVENDRLDEAAALSLRYADRYPLPLVPNVIAGIAQLFVDAGDEGAARDYLREVLVLYPGNETAGRALADLDDNP